MIRADARAAARELDARYGLAEPKLGARLDGGFANDLFRVEAGGRSWVLRLERAPVDEASLAWEHATVRRLAERFPEACAPRAALDGTTWFAVGDRAATLLPFVDGAPADPWRAAHRDAAAVALGRLHAAGAELDVEPHPSLVDLPRMAWPEPAMPEPLADRADEITGAREWAIDCVRRLAADAAPVTGLVHGDFFPGNVLVNEGRPAAVLDWEEAHHDWVSWDLANALSTFCFTGDELDRGAARRFLHRYREAGGTAPRAERRLLVPLMRAKRTLEVLRAPTDREPRWAHQRHNLRSLRHLRDPEVLAIGDGAAGLDFDESS